MKRLLLVLAAGLATSGLAAAQYPPPGAGGYPNPYAGGPMPAGFMGGGGAPPQSMGYGQMPMPESSQAAIEKKKYGWLPAFRGIFGKKSDGGCSTCGNGNGNGNGGDGRYFSKSKVKPQPLPGAEGGTLVFPHHPYVRSPRDFFMQD